VIQESREIEVGGACGTHGRGARGFRVLVGKPEGKRPVGKPRSRWEDGMWNGFNKLVIGTDGVLL
jgi:hypothetical protein